MKWTMKYKKSINCKDPKGFSQKQYCKYGKDRKDRKGHKSHKTRTRKNLNRLPHK